MARLLKQSTAKILRIGPFLDETDGVTAETGLTISQADIQISKNGGAFAQTSAASPTTTHDTDGWYQCPLTATDTNTLGPLTVQIVESGALPVWEHFMVVPANVYDSLVGGSDALQVHANEITAGLITAAAIATDAIDADALAADAIAEINATVDTALSDYDAPTSAELVSEINSVQTDIAALSIPTAADVRTEIDSNSTQLAAIVADTNELQTDDVPGLIAALNNISVANILTTAMTEAYAAEAGTLTIAQALYEILQFLTEKSVSGTAVTVKKRDGSTTATAYTLDDSSTPTSITRST